MTLAESFSTLNLDDSPPETVIPSDPMHIEDHLSYAVYQLSLTNKDLYQYIHEVKELRNEWFKAGVHPESKIYELLASGLSSVCPELVYLWKIEGYPLTIYQFEYQVFTHFQNLKTNT
jgi:hypothetical protein